MVLCFCLESIALSCCLTYLLLLHNRVKVNNTNVILLAYGEVREIGELENSLGEITAIDRWIGSANFAQPARTDHH